MNAYKPTIAVRVIDRKNNSVYLWSLERLQQQLQRMRNVTLFVDRPNVSQHFATLEPFYSQDPPEYSFIGVGVVSFEVLKLTHPISLLCCHSRQSLGRSRSHISFRYSVDTLQRHSGHAKCS